MSSERDEIAAVLAAVIDRRTGRHMGVDSWMEAGRECADALTDWLAERDRRTAATAVREAAEAGPSSTPTDELWLMFLRDRADRIERGE